MIRARLVEDRRYLATIAVAGMVALAACAPVSSRPPAARAAVSAPAATATDGVRSHGPGTVEIDAASLAAGSFAVHTDPNDDVRGAVLTVTVSGDDVSLPGGPVAEAVGVRGANRTVDAAVTADPVVGPPVAVTADPPAGDTPEGAAEAPADPSAPSPALAVDPAEAVADGSVTKIVATLAGSSVGSGRRSVSDIVWVEKFAGATVVSDTGEQDLRLKKVGVLSAAGAVTADEAAALRQKILGGVAASAKVTPSTCADICVHGNVVWTDSAGGKHPVRNAPVEIRDAEGGVNSELVGTVTTDNNGNYAALVNNADGAGENGRDIFVRVRAAGPGFNVKQYIEGPVDTDVATGSDIEHNFVADNEHDNNTAFSVQNALVVGLEYIQLRHGSRFVDFEVNFPNPEGSFYNGSSLNVLGPDRFDWDVILHEYGHFVADQLNIEQNPGGPHSGLDNLADEYGKKDGTLLAFGEGWPTYFAISLQQVMGTAALNIPDVGDDRYQDTEDSTIDYSLESAALLGEDNEVTVSAILYDVYDSAEDGLDRVALGDKVVWDTLDAGDPARLYDAYKLLAPGGSFLADRINCVFSQMNVSPKLNGPALEMLSKSAPAPTYTWTKGNGGPYPNDSWVLELRDASGRNVLFSSPTLTTTTYTVPAATWASVLDTSNGLIQVVVAGSQGDEPVTGPYRSCKKQLVVRSLDVVFAIDSTQSMTDDIAAVRLEATEITMGLLAAGVDVRVAVVDYKDAGEPYQAKLDLPFSTDGAAVVAALDAITPSGVDDPTASVYSGVMTALAQPFRDDVDKKAVIVLGDSPASDPEPGTNTTLAAVTAAAAAGGVSTSGAPVSGLAIPAPSVPAKVFSVAFDSDTAAASSLKALAEGTGGKSFAPANTPAVLQAILFLLVEELDNPYADAAGAYSATVGTPVTFDGSRSASPKGTLVKFEWDVDNNGTYDVSSTTATTPYTYTAPYTGKIALRVTDNAGRTDVALADAAAVAAAAPTTATTAPTTVPTPPTTAQVKGTQIDNGAGGDSLATTGGDPDRPFGLSLLMLGAGLCAVALLLARRQNELLE